MRGQIWGSSIDFDRLPYNWSSLPCCLWCGSAPLVLHLISLMSMTHLRETRAGI